MGKPLFAGEFNRLDRAGDYMEGDLQLLDIAQPNAGLIEWLAAVAGIRNCAVRGNGNDLEFFDLTTGVWTTLSALKAGGLVASFEQEFITVGGETGFTLTGGNAYVPGTQTVFVNRSGILLPRSEIVETSPTRVDLAVTQPPVAPAEKIVVFVMAGSGVDTFAVKGDAADAAPSNLDDKTSGSGAVVKSVTGSPANSVVDFDVPFAIVAPPADGGVGAIGVSTNVARQDHQHPADDWDNLAAHTQGEVPTFAGVGGVPTRIGPGTSGQVLKAKGAGADAVFEAADWDETASKTQGEVPAYGAAGAPTRVGPGNAGEVLTSNGAGATPSFQAVAGPSNVVKKGSYTGDGVNGRTISTGFSTECRLVEVFGAPLGVAISFHARSGWGTFIRASGGGAFQFVAELPVLIQMSGANFVVGPGVGGNPGANQPGVVYNWVAVGV